MDERKQQPASVKVANAYPTIASGAIGNLFVEIWQDRDFHRQGRFSVTEIRDRVSQRCERAHSRDAAIALAAEWGYGDLVEAIDRTHFSGTTTIVVTTSVLVPQVTRSIDARDLRVELRQQLPSDVERVLAHGVVTVYDQGDGSYAPHPTEEATGSWIHDDELRAAIGALPRDQRAWVVAVASCGDVGVAVASFSRVS